jgi:hypothetical protein
MKVRRITWIGFALAMLALMLVGRVPPLISLIVGLVGIVISIIALWTSKETTP